MDFPNDLRYNQEHQWARLENEHVVVGITDFAQDELGELVYVGLPSVADRVEAGQPFGEVESSKTASEVYAPVGGVVTAVNDVVVDNPTLLNENPYGTGWLVRIQPDDITQWETLLDASAYSELVRGLAH